MRQRIRTSLVLMVLIVPVLWFGDVLLFPFLSLFDLFFGVLAMMGAWELDRLFAKQSGTPRFARILSIAAAGGLFAVLFLEELGVVAFRTLLLSIASFFVVQSAIMVFVDSYKASHLGHQFVIVLYPALGFAAVSSAYRLGLEAILYLVLVAMATDTAAYFFGVRFGKHKMIPAVSPKKSFEGAIAGLVFGGGFAALFAILTGMDPQFGVFGWIVLSLGLSAVSQLGDLVASKIKRSYDVKDFSNLFPGHGGVLDRFDSIIYAAMVFAIVLRLLS
jgi:phosphatidate cytidylyltransferase